LRTQQCWKTAWIGRWSEGVLIILRQPLGLPVEEVEDAAMLEDGMDWQLE